jgi:hypothetical protein
VTEYGPVGGQAAGPFLWGFGLVLEWVGVPPNASGIITPSATSQIMKCPRRTIATATAKDRRASVKNGARFDQFPLHAAESVGALSRRANKEWTSVIFNIVPGIGELLTRCGPYCDSPNLKRPNFNSMRVTERARCDSKSTWIKRI